MKLLLLNTAILAAGDLTETADSIQSADAIYPKHVIPGWQIVDAPVPEGFTPAGYTWDGAQVVAKPPVFVPPTEADYIAALEAHYDATAQQQRYDNRLTCALRAGYTGPYQAQGAAFGTWMDACNSHAYSVMADVVAGARPQPTIAELIAEMPPMVWPV